MKLYKINKQYFTVPTLENCYWAGFIAADGCLWKRGDAVEIGLQELDKSHLELFAKTVGYTGCVAKRKIPGSYHSNQDGYRVIFYGVQQWHKDLYKHFHLTPRKSLTLQSPHLSGKLALAYIAGYIDGDGCINIDNSRKNGIRISILGTKDFLLWTKRHFDQVSDYNYNHQGFASPRKHRNVFQYQVRGVRANSFFKAIRKLNLPLLSRKWSKFEYVAS